MASAAAPVTSIDIDQDLPDVWAFFVSKLEGEAGFTIQPNKTLTIEDVITKIEPASSATPTFKSRAKKVFKASLVCIDKIGSVVTQGASAVFGPSTQVYNAISFVIHVCQGSMEVFEDLVDVMESLSNFLQRLQAYMEDELETKLDRSVRRAVYKALEQFVAILALSYNLTRSKWAKTKVFLKKGTLGSDGGVKDAIETSKKLVDEITKVQIDSIHRNTNKNTQTLGDIEKTVTDVRTTNQQTVGMLAETKEDMLNKNIETSVRQLLQLVPEDTELHARMHTERFATVVGTGAWLLQREEFKSWCDLSTDTTSRILCVQGPTGYGKSYLAHAVVDHLATLTGDPSTTTAWHYFEADTLHTSWTHALRHVIWQVARHDTSYMSFLRDKGRRGYKFSSASAFEDLILSYNRERSTTTTFIVLDAVDQAVGDVQHLHKLVTQLLGSKSRIRLLLTGTQEVLESVETALPTINLVPPGDVPVTELPQYEDTRIFAGSRLDGCKLFQGTLSDVRRELRSRLLDGMTAAARGDYTILDRQLLEIANSDDEASAEHVLANVNADSKIFMQEEIKRLNAELSGERINQLNLIFSWVSAARIDVNAELIRPIATMMFKGQALTDPVGYLRKHCKRLIDIGEDGTITFKSEAESVLQKAEPARKVVTEAEVDMVQAMLQTQFRTVFGSSKIYDRFDFDQFFQDKRAIQTDLIYLPDRATVSLLILEPCLRVICEHRDDDEYAPLLSYAMHHFGYHLTEVPIEAVSTTQKQQLARYLYRILNDIPIINDFVSVDATYGLMLYDWLNQDDQFCQSIVSWFTDREVAKSIRTMTSSKVSIDDVANKAKQSVLARFSEQVLNAWYQSTWDKLGGHLRWLRAYWRLTTPAEQPVDDIFGSDMTLAELIRWEEWARPQLGADFKSQQWHTRLTHAAWYWADYNAHKAPDVDEPYPRDTWSNSDLVLELDREGLLKKAIEYCEQAIDAADAIPWQLLYTKGAMYFWLSRYTDTVRIVTAAVDDPAYELRKGGENETAYRDTVLYTIALGRRYLEHHDEAGTAFKILIELGLELDYLTYNLINCVDYSLELHIRQGLPDQAQEILNSIKDYKGDDGSEVPWLRRILAGPLNNLHNHMIGLATTLDLFDFVDGLYDATMPYWLALEYHNYTAMLKLNRSRVRWFAKPHQRAEILDEYQELFRLMLSLDQDMFSDQTRQAGRYYLDALTSQVHATEDADKRSSLMTKVQQMEYDTATLARDGYLYSARHILARLDYLQGKHSQARNRLQAEIWRAIKDLRQDPYNEASARALTDVLGRVNDDEHALTAWSLRDPDRTHQSNKDVYARSADGDSDGADISAERLYGEMRNYCDGCAMSWYYPDDIYDCRDCVDVQLCKKCFVRLSAGTLNRSVCDVNHSHIHIPPLDFNKWRALKHEEVRHRGEVLTRHAWLERLAQDWELDKWDRAAAGIEKAQILWLERKKAQNKVGTESSYDSWTYLAALVLRRKLAAMTGDAGMSLCLQEFVSK